MLGTLLLTPHSQMSRTYRFATEEPRNHTGFRKETKQERQVQEFLNYIRLATNETLERIERLA